jgi:hypothetical protein
MLRKRDKTKKFFLIKELMNLRNSKKKKLPKNLRPRRWNKNSSLLKLSKKPRLLLPRKLLLRLT